MLPPIRLPEGSSLHRHGHVLVLSGYWDRELLDELEHGLLDLRHCLPRAPGRKLVTLHLFNLTMATDTVSGALSIVRRTFVDLPVDVAVVAEGNLGQAGLLFLAGSQAGFRKVFEDLQVEARLHGANPGPVGFASTPTSNPPPAELRLLPESWQITLTSGQTLSLSASDLLGHAADKRLSRS